KGVEMPWCAHDRVPAAAAPARWDLPALDDYTWDMSSEHRPLMRLRVEEGCRRIALEYLTAATRARGRLDDPEDTEALHDLRVGLRRLRSLERAYRPQLADSISRKLRQKPRELAAATNVARDTEVQLEWLAQQRDHLNPRHRRGVEWMREWLERRKVAAY